MHMVQKTVGKSIYFTHVFTELAKLRNKEDNFEDLMSLEYPAFQKIKKEFEHRLNKQIDYNSATHILKESAEQLPFG